MMKTNNQIEIYQIAPEPTSLMMCYIIKTCENKIIVIDGGIDGFGKNNPIYLPSAIRAILGIGQDAFFEIEAWFLTHFHRDHYFELAKMMRDYSKDSNYKINHLYFDFPPINNGWRSAAGDGDENLDENEIFYESFHNYARVSGLTGWDYSSINGAVINKSSVEEGLSFVFDNVTIDILQTWSQTDRYVNSTSLIMRMHANGKTILFLGDASQESTQRLTEHYDATEIASDFIQMSHHGQNGAPKEFYDLIDARNSKRLWATPIWVWNAFKHPSLSTDKTREWVGLCPNALYFDRTDSDVISGLYDAYPKDPTLVSAWTEDVLRAQLVWRA